VLYYAEWLFRGKEGPFGPPDWAFAARDIDRPPLRREVLCIGLSKGFCLKRAGMHRARQAEAAARCSGEAFCEF